MKENKVTFGNNVEQDEISEDFVCRTVNFALTKMKREGCAVSVVLISEDDMHRLNLDYRKVDSSTDVLTFCYGEGEKMPDGGDEGAFFLGEIYVSPADVRANAEYFNEKYIAEVGRVLVHGTLHLLGFDHDGNDVNENEMLEIQEKILDELRSEAFF